MKLWKSAIYKNLFYEFKSFNRDNRDKLQWYVHLHIFSWSFPKTIALYYQKRAEEERISYCYIGPIVCYARIFTFCIADDNLVGIFCFPHWHIFKFTEKMFYYYIFRMVAADMFSLITVSDTPCNVSPMMTTTTEFLHRECERGST